MKKLLLLLLLASFCGFAQERVELSPAAEISVITCGPGQEELYSAFGHSAIRVFDPGQQMDLAFNYGVFDFDQPNFYLNFAKGFLYYKLGVHDYPRFEEHYSSANRYVHEQVLNLSAKQKQRVMDFLLWNARPENENYRYDYFYNNCATKMPAVLIKSLGDSVRFNDSHIKTNYTIRDLTDIYLREQPWGDLGIDICLGLPMDKKAAPFEYMFLPDYVEKGFNNATIMRDGNQVPLVKETLIKNEQHPADSPSGMPHPLLVFSIIAAVIGIISYRDYRRKKTTKWLDILIFGITGLIGVLLFFLWFFTDHNAAARNLNILWALPTHVVAAILIIKNPAWLRPYFGFTFVMCGLILAGWVVLPQHLHYALIPIILSVGLRAFINYSLSAKVEEVDMLLGTGS